MSTTIACPHGFEQHMCIFCLRVQSETERGELLAELDAANATIAELQHEISNLTRERDAALRESQARMQSIQDQGRIDNATIAKLRAQLERKRGVDTDPMIEELRKLETESLDLWKRALLVTDEAKKLRNDLHGRSARFQALRDTVIDAVAERDKARTHLAAVTAERDDWAIEINEVVAEAFGEAAPPPKGPFDEKIKTVLRNLRTQLTAVTAERDEVHARLAVVTAERDTMRGMPALEKEPR